jgi:Flp pilus assembly protein TadG
MAFVNKTIRSTHRQRGGQALVEFALLAPVMILILLAILAFGLVFSWQNVLNNAAREGARAGAVAKTDAQIKSNVMQNVSLLPHCSTVLDGIVIIPKDENGVSLPAGTRQHGGSITVQLSYPASIVAIPGIMSSEKTLVAKSTFRME